ncbi:MAG: UvrD-helicase domain-containing protein, partial [Planctomycetota bacterium]|nr:UvrD-helicase domain-containing protein [Planctomycetota bacterium]
MSAGLPPPSDAPARAAIEFELETNFAVEAAAGAGKTTCLVRRLLQLFRRGALADGSRLAAVTFTHKAAAELRDRLDAALALAPSAELTAAERENLAAARRALPECHVGTIHSFCARLLRERPVEAGVGPGFREMEDEEDELFRRRAWDKFAAEAMRAGDSGLIRTLAAFGLDLESLRPGFESFAAYPDVACWPGGESVPELDCAALVAGAGGYLDGLLGDPGRRELLEADGDAGTDELIPALRLLRRRLRRLSGRAGLAEALDIEALLRERPRIIDKKWRPFGADKDGVKAAYDEFYARTVLPFRQARLAQVYAVVMAAFERAAAIYDRLRRRAGRLNFQDLLLGAAKLLRDYPRVRADLARRYARLLIDETQDTDPVQAEIMFLLASDDPNETDWRRCRPRPGALFVVGDPKQSIYRFRRADIAVYQEAKRLIVAGGGRVLGLTANFRGQPEVLAWINRTFGPAAEGAAAEGRFSAAESPHGPAYAPLEPGLPSRPAGCFGGVYFLETIPVGRAAGVAAADAMADEADRIARFIRNAVDQKLPLPLKDGQKAAEPGDFLLITRNKRHTAVYAGALRRLGLACRESGGAALAGSAAARQLADYLAALAAPYDPVPALAVLRGPLFGL